VCFVPPNPETWLHAWLVHSHQGDNKNSGVAMSEQLSIEKKE